MLGTPDGCRDIPGVLRLIRADRHDLEELSRRWRARQTLCWI
jgi:hypothetical protein